MRYYIKFLVILWHNVVHTLSNKTYTIAIEDNHDVCKPPYAVAIISVYQSSNNKM